MKRNDDYLRELLLECEQNDQWIFMQGNPGHQYSDVQKRYFHLQLLCDADYLEVLDGKYFRITNQGHDFIAAIRDEGIWNQAKKTVSEAGGNATIEILKSLAIGFLKKKISQHTDIEL